MRRSTRRCSPNCRPTAQSAARPASRSRSPRSTASRTTTRAISDYLSSLQLGDGGATRAEFPAQANGRFVKLQDLRYGENPHQSAAFYRDLHPAPGSLVTARQLQGKELSYNNIADADAAWECVKGFAAPASDVAAVSDRRRGGRLRHRQARQPVRRRARRRCRRGLCEGVPDRPDLGVRRHHRVQHRSSTALRPRWSASSSSRC